ncbi:hypothetical protein [Butyricimonas virosa]
MSKKELLRKFVVDLETILRDFNREFGYITDLPIDSHVENFQDEICAAVDSVLGIYTRVMLSEIDDLVFKEGGER